VERWSAGVNARVEITDYDQSTATGLAAFFRDPASEIKWIHRGPTPDLGCPSATKSTRSHFEAQCGKEPTKSSNQPLEKSGVMCKGAPFVHSQKMSFHLGRVEGSGVCRRCNSGYGATCRSLTATTSDTRARVTIASLMESILPSRISTIAAGTK
jgi:hypothetical protein